MKNIRLSYYEGHSLKIWRKTQLIFLSIKTNFYLHVFILSNRTFKNFKRYAVIKDVYKWINFAIIKSKKNQIYRKIWVG